MIEQLWNAYTENRFQDGLALAADHLVAQNSIDALHIAGLCLLEMHRVEDALLLLKAAIVLRPDAPHIYSNAAYIAEKFGLVEALRFFVDRGLGDFPDHLDLQRSKAISLLLDMDNDGAMTLCRSLLACDPNDVSAHLTLARAYEATGHLDYAEQQFAAAHHHAPDNPHVTVGLAALYRKTGRTEAAVGLLDGVDDPDARYLLALCLLTLGEYQRGWALHFDRWEAQFFRRHPRPTPPFRSLDEVAGKRVAVLREGGFGDVFQFMRYLPLLARLARSVVLYGVHPSEMRLLKANLKNVLIQQHEPLEDHDCATSILDLPYHFASTIETIPCDFPYLYVPFDIMYQRLLPPSTKKRVGLVWTGGVTINAMHHERRSIDGRLLGNLADIDVEWVSLHIDRGNDTGLALTHLLPVDADWLDTAAILRQLDLIITVDTAVAHLAGALDCPTWLLTRSDPCWRWALNQSPTPWYPSLRIFGQREYDEWPSVIARVRKALIKWTLTKSDASGCT